MIIRYLRTRFHTLLSPTYHMELEKALKDCRSVLDVGCGTNSPIKECSLKAHTVGVDAYKPSIKTSREQKIHDKYYCIDILDIEKKFRKDSFDCVLALDVIEHLKKKDGLKLLDSMERLAKKKVIIFTPNGFLPQGAAYGNPWQVHRSGWKVKEMKDRGYKVIGIHGWKPLRGEEAKVKFRPTRLWQMLSEMTQPFVKYKPELAFHILCIKTQQ